MKPRPTVDAVRATFMTGLPNPSVTVAVNVPTVPFESVEAPVSVTLRAPATGDAPT